ncbi:type II secretion system F family protein [Sphingomonas sp. 3-13AW]|uniref:type II secretion system F family protein n=1 Tax=Sphingomonas sp. 3-13AW TaxID=3050450 RepID=UPI003BB6231E
MHVTWQARIRKGHSVEEITVVGATIDEARRAAANEGQVISVRPAKKNFLKVGMSRHERYVFLMRLATMIGSKVPPNEALRMMISSFQGRIGEAAKSAYPLVVRGKALGEVLSEDARNFPGSIGLLIKTGSASGNTADALIEAAEFERHIGEATKNTMIALVRSFLYMLIALALLVGNQYFIIPKMFDSPIMRMGKKIDIDLYLSVGFWTMVLTIGIMTLLVSLIFLATLGRRAAPDKVDSFILKLPVMRDLVISQDNYVGLFRLALLIKAGVPMGEALNSCADSTRPGALREDFRRAYRGMRKGEKWALFMKTLHPTDRAALVMMPDNDELAKNLNYIADMSKALYLQRLGIISPVMDTVSAGLITVAGIVVLFVTTVPQLQLVSEVMS